MDWMSENEEVELKRKAYNDLMHEVKNLSPTEEKWLKRGSAAIFVCAVILICAIFLRIAVEVLRGIM